MDLAFQWKETENKFTNKNRICQRISETGRNKAKQGRKGVLGVEVRNGICVGSLRGDPQIK